MLNHLNDLLTSMWPTLADAAIKSAAVLALTATIALLLRRSSAARRHLVWTAGLCALLLLPLLTLLMPRWQIRLTEPTPAARPSVTVADATGSFALPLDLHLPHSSAAHAMQLPAAEAASSAPSRLGQLAGQWRTVLVWAWLIGAAIVLARTLAGIFSLMILSRRSKPVVDSTWEDVLTRGCEQLRINRRVVLLINGKRIMPMTWGIIRPRILLPGDAAQWPAEQRKIVVLHELAHICRHDCLIHLIAQLAKAAFWFNPLCWVAVRQMMLDRELASDDLVISKGVLASDYAENLINIASCFKLDRLFPTAAIAMARSSKLGVRVQAVLDPARRRHLAGQWFGMGVCAAAVLLLMPLAMIEPFAANAQAPAVTAASGNTPAADLKLPPIPEHTEFLTHADFSRLTPESLDAAASTVFGKVFHDGGADKMALGDFKRFHDVVTHNGASQVWMTDIIIGHGGPNPYNPEIIVEVKDAKQADGIRADMEKLPQHGGSEYLVDDNYLIIRRNFNRPTEKPGIVPMPAPNDPATAASFDKALKSYDPESPVQLVFIFDSDMKQATATVPKDAPQSVQDMAQIAQLCDSLRITARVSETPTVALALQSSDAANARKAADLVNRSLRDIVPAMFHVQTPGQGAQPNEADTEKALAGITDSLKDVKAVTTDEHTDVTVSTAELQKAGSALNPILARAKAKAGVQQAASSERQFALGVILYANEHNGQLPDKLEDVETYLGGADNLKQLLKNPNVPDKAVGYIYEKPAEKMGDIKSPTPMIWEVNPADGKKSTTGMVGYSDGHAELARPN